MPTLDELMERESPEYEAQWRRAMEATRAQSKRDIEHDPIYDKDELDLPECPLHGEYLDDDGGCCLCYEQTGDDFAYREVAVA